MPADSGDQRELVARLRTVIEAKDAKNAPLRAELEAQRERCRRLERRVAELERRLGSDSTMSERRRRRIRSGRGAAQG